MTKKGGGGGEGREKGQTEGNRPEVEGISKDPKAGGVFARQKRTKKRQCV